MVALNDQSKTLGAAFLEAWGQYVAIRNHPNSPIKRTLAACRHAHAAMVALLTVVNQLNTAYEAAFGEKLAKADLFEETMQMVNNELSHWEEQEAEMDAACVGTPPYLSTLPRYLSR